MYITSQTFIQSRVAAANDPYTYIKPDTTNCIMMMLAIFFFFPVLCCIFL